MDKHFIATTDPDTAKALRKLGFQELPKEGNRWMFLNKIVKDGNFSSSDLKMSYTDKLTF